MDHPYCIGYFEGANPTGRYDLSLERAVRYHQGWLVVEMRANANGIHLPIRSAMKLNGTWFTTTLEKIRSTKRGAAIWFRNEKYETKAGFFVNERNDGYLSVATQAGASDARPILAMHVFPDPKDSKNAFALQEVA